MISHIKTLNRIDVFLRNNRLYSKLVKRCIFAVALLIYGSAQAQEVVEGGYSNSSLGQETVKERSWEFTYKAYVENTLEVEREFDLNDSKPDDTTISEPEAGLKLLLDSDDRFRLFGELLLSRRYFLDNDTNKSPRDWQLNVEQAYFEYGGSQDDFKLRLGRQTFADKMEWLYDADLDGIRLFYELGQINLELSATEEETFNGDVLNNRSDRNERIRNYMFVASYAPKKKVNISGYVIYLDERAYKGSRPEDLLFVGVQSVGKVNSNFSYWLNAAYVTGERTRSSDVRKIEANGLDIGATFVLDKVLEPSFTLGYAYGSGDGERSEGKDRNFRQTGLQDNDYRFNGVTSFRYLGELVDPELSNMSIVTVGIGFRPTKKSSIDIVYHRYDQVKAVDRLTGTNIDRDPLGISKDLGYELDVIIGSREIDDVYIEGVFGYFSPGKAFKSTADDAFFAAFEIGLKF
ncbi:MAG: alginate export family protein [Motiliproteus sp.]